MGCVRSMGTIVMQACKERFLHKNCDFMIHNGTDGFYGNALDAEVNGEQSVKYRKIMYKIYYDRMKRTNKKITLHKLEDMCIKDCFLTSSEAVKAGLADKVINRL